jgi:hypothetical protein
MCWASDITLEVVFEWNEILACVGNEISRRRAGDKTKGEFDGWTPFVSVNVAGGDGAGSA